jgi:hypothetical protein
VGNYVITGLTTYPLGVATTAASKSGRVVLRKK